MRYFSASRGWQVRSTRVPHVYFKADVISVLLFCMLVTTSRGCMVLCMFPMHLPNLPVVHSRDTRISKRIPTKRDAYFRQVICKEQNSHQATTLRLHALIGMRHLIYEIADICHLRVTIGWQLQGRAMSRLCGDPPTENSRCATCAACAITPFFGHISKIRD
jgi:hypothetical protein